MVAVRHAYRSHIIISVSVVFERIYTASHQEIGAGYWKTTLINGKGRNEDIDGNLNKFEVVSPGDFFAINHLGNDGFYQITVDNHFIEVHELDGKPIKKLNNVFLHTIRAKLRVLQLLINKKDSIGLI